MQFEALPLEGAYLIKPDRHSDDRGFFARTFCNNDFKKHGLVSDWVQMSTSFNHKQGQIRGMHFQENPFSETKLIRCTKGVVLDVIIDLRPASLTYNQHYSVELSETNCFQLYVPKNFAHGYKTLTDNAELFYMMDQFYVKEAAREIECDEGLFK
jgi:dTDP-4-dehydrorhamnose 3,5-epimerase